MMSEPFSPFDLPRSDFISRVSSSLLARKHILGKVGLMAGARILALAFGAVGAIWAARCLGPHNLGISGMVQNIVTQAAVLLGVIYSTVLVREYKNARTDEARNQLIQVSTTFRLLGALFFCIIGAGIMAFRLVPIDYHFAGWFFIPLLLLGTIQPAWVFQAAEKQHFQSIIAVLQPALAAGLYLWLFRSGMPAWADLAVITTITAILTVLYWRAIYRLTPLKGSLIDFHGFQKARELILKSRWLFISSLAIYVYTTLEQPLLGWLYSLEELGQYRTAVTIASVAQSFIFIILNILYPRFLEWRKRGEAVLWRRQRKLALLFLVVGFVSSIIIFIILPPIYPYIYGDTFQKAAIPCAFLLVGKFSVLLNGIFLFGLMTDQKNDKAICFCTIGMAIISLSFNFLLVPRFGMYATSIMNLASESILFIIYIILSKVRMKNGVLSRAER